MWYKKKGETSVREEENVQKLGENGGEEGSRQNLTTHNSTERDEYQEKWFNIEDRSKKLHHTRTYVYKNNSDSASATQLVHTGGQRKIVLTAKSKSNL